MLLRFSTRSQREEVERLAQRAKFYRELTSRLTVELARVKAELEKNEPPPPKPEIVHDPIDDQLQTGDSRLLGGGMSIHAPHSEQNRNSKNRADFDR